jgi:hypothetical protein
LCHDCPWCHPEQVDSWLQTEACRMLSSIGWRRPEAWYDCRAWVCRESCTILVEEWLKSFWWRRPTSGAT